MGNLMSDTQDQQFELNYDNRPVPTFLLQNDHDCSEEQCHLDPYPIYRMEMSPELGSVLFRLDSCRQMSIVTSFDDAVLADAQQGEILIYRMSEDMEQILSSHGIVGSKIQFEGGETFSTVLAREHGGPSR